MQLRGSPMGTATPSASRRRPASSAAAEALLTGDRGEERAPLAHQLVGPVLHGRIVDGPQTELVDRQRAEDAHQVVQLVDVAREAPLDQALQLELEVGQHVGVDQLP